MNELQLFFTTIAAGMLGILVVIMKNVYYNQQLGKAMDFFTNDIVRQMNDEEMQRLAIVGENWYCIQRRAKLMLELKAAIEARLKIVDKP